MELYTRFYISYQGQQVDIPDWISWTLLVTDLRVDRMSKSWQASSLINDTSLFNNLIMLVYWDKIAGTNPNANIIIYSYVWHFSRRIRNIASAITNSFRFRSFLCSIIKKFTLHSDKPLKVPTSSSTNVSSLQVLHSYYIYIIILHTQIILRKLLSTLFLFPLYLFLSKNVKLIQKS
jgi:hypothetical protein